MSTRAQALPPTTATVRSCETPHPSTSSPSSSFCPAFRARLCPQRGSAGCVGDTGLRRERPPAPHRPPLFPPLPPGTASTTHPESHSSSSLRAAPGDTGASDPRKVQGPRTSRAGKRKDPQGQSTTMQAPLVLMRAVGGGWTRVRRPGPKCPSWAMLWVCQGP